MDRFQSTIVIAQSWCSSKSVLHPSYITIMNDQRKVLLQGLVTLNGYFFQLIHFSKDMKHDIWYEMVANPCRSHSHFPHNLWSSYEYLIYYQSDESRALYMVI